MDHAPQADVSGFWAIPDLPGDTYVWALAQLHQRLKPRRYLEIGTESGLTLALAECASIAVDPNFRVHRDIIGRKPSCYLFQMTSDQFFQKHLSLDEPMIDFAFIDGLHHFEQTLRDFMNVERHVTTGAVIMLHDCIPTDAYAARREYDDKTFLNHTRFPRSYWAGDVWKVLPILQEYRPDLKLHIFNAQPTGLVAVTRLEPKSNILQQAYSEIVQRFMPLTVPDYSKLKLLGASTIADVLGSSRLAFNPSASLVGAPVPKP